MGSVYRRGRIWWIAYCRNGRQFCESAHTDDYEAARDQLRKTEGDLARGLPVTPKMSRVLFSELAQDLVTEYATNHRRSLYDLHIRLNNHLLPVFRHRRAWTITSSDILRYTEDRQAAMAKNATINRELAAMKRAFNLGIQGRKILLAPYIPMLKEQNVRTGFFERAELLAILRHLPLALHPLVWFAYITGWRIATIRRLQWQQVDFTLGTVRLEVGTTKNDEGVVFPINLGLKTFLEAQAHLTEKVQAQRAIICPWVFHRNGRPIRAFKNAWRKACLKAGLPGRLVHDFRRTAVRNLVNAGVREKVAMQMTGHRTRSVFDRYHIVSPEDLAEAGRKLEAVTTFFTTMTVENPTLSLGERV
jgi:integrase